MAEQGHSSKLATLNGSWNLHENLKDFGHLLQKRECRCPNLVWPSERLFLLDSTRLKAPCHSLHDWHPSKSLNCPTGEHYGYSSVKDQDVADIIRGQVLHVRVCLHASSFDVLQRQAKVWLAFQTKAHLQVHRYLLQERYNSFLEWTTTTRVVDLAKDLESHGTTPKDQLPEILHRDHQGANHHYALSELILDLPRLRQCEPLTRICARWHHQVPDWNH